MTRPFLSYRRSRFSTRLPLDRRYTEAHFWILPETEGACRVGFTRFATRMLGEIVEFDFELPEGSAVEEGDVVGWAEGFKAVTELYSPLAGRFRGGNEALGDLVGEIHRAPYDDAWLYRVEGTAPDAALDAEGYARFLDSTIDRMMGRAS